MAASLLVDSRQPLVQWVITSAGIYVQCVTTKSIQDIGLAKPRTIKNEEGCIAREWVDQVWYQTELIAAYGDIVHLS